MNLLKSIHKEAIEEFDKKYQILETRYEDLRQRHENLGHRHNALLVENGAIEGRERCQLEARFQKLLSQSATMETRIRRSHVKDDHRIREMEESLLKDATTWEGKKLTDKALTDIEEFQASLENFKIEAEVGMIKATREQLERIETEIAKHEELK